MAGWKFQYLLKDAKLILMDCEYTQPDHMLIDCIIAVLREKTFQEWLLKNFLSNSRCLRHKLNFSQIKTLKHQQCPLNQNTSHQVRRCPTKEIRLTGNKHWSTRQQTALSMEKTRSTNGTKESAQQKAVCSYCYKPNHWVAECNTQSQYWMKKVLFRIDTGAKCNTLLHHIKEQNKCSVWDLGRCSRERSQWHHSWDTARADRARWAVIFPHNLQCTSGLVCPSVFATGLCSHTHRN